MAEVRAYAPINLINPETWYGDVIGATSNEIVISDGYTTSVYLGTGFTYSGNNVVGGTFTAYGVYVGGALVGEAFGYEIPAAVAATYINTNNLPMLFSIALAGNDNIIGSPYSDTLAGYTGNDIIFGGAGANYIDGGQGTDIAIYDVQSPSILINLTPSAIYVETLDGSVSDTLVHVERLGFLDGTLAFDEEAAQAYRLYQAAFGRTPDKAGLSHWVKSLDDGYALSSAASDFIGSAEFQSLYGANTTNADFVNLLYLNVLDRAADQGGYDYWNSQFAAGLSRADALVQFSESTENKVAVQGQIANGIWLDADVFV